MQFKQLALALPIFLGAAMAGRDNIGFGQQIQTNDEANHWVVWIEGEDACSNTKTLNYLTDSACDETFTYDGVDYYLSDCDGNNEPHSLYVDGEEDGIECNNESNGGKSKITCHGDLHDIVKHGYCKW